MPPPHVTIMGLGHFGGGVGVAKYFAHQGSTVIVTDSQPAEKLTASIEQIQNLIDAGTVELHLGAHDLRDFTNTDLVVANPAVATPWHNQYLRAAAQANVPITTEFNIALTQLKSRDRVIAITGTAGKSTTSAMIAHILKSTHPTVVFAGNIGGSTIAQLSNTPLDAFVVLEVSSFMLYWLSNLPRHDGFHPPTWCDPQTLPAWPPRVAAITNISDNHLDWHTTMHHYRQCKQQITSRQHAGDTLITSSQVAAHNSISQLSAATQITLTHSDLIKDLAIPGTHNQRNARMAVEVCLAADKSLARDAASAAVRSFPGLSHRLELVGDIPVGTGTAKAYNDSKSTTPQACVLAVDAFADDSSRVHLIAGGYDKKSDLSDIASLAPRLAGLYTIGATGPAIASAASIHTTQCGSLHNALIEIKRRIKPGDVILLSPGCASWDQYENYEKRGEEFRAIIQRELSGTTP